MSVNPACMPRATRRVGAQPFGLVEQGGDRSFRNATISEVLTVGSQATTPLLYTTEIASMENLNVSVCENLSVVANNGTFAFGNDLNVVANNNIVLDANNVVVEGNLVVNGSLDICEISCANGNLTIDSNNVFFTGNVSVQDGTLDVCAISSQGCANNSLTITANDVFFSNNVNVANTIQVCDLLCTGNLEINAANLVLNSNLFTNQLTVNNFLNVVGDANFNDQVNIVGQLNVCTIACPSGNVTIADNLTVSNSLTVNNNLVVNDSLTVNNNLLVNNNLTVNGTLEVCDITCPSGNLTISNTNVVVNNGSLTVNTLNVVDSANINVLNVTTININGGGGNSQINVSNVNATNVDANSISTNFLTVNNNLSVNANLFVPNLVTIAPGQFVVVNPNTGRIGTFTNATLPTATATSLVLGWNATSSTATRVPLSVAPAGGAQQMLTRRSTDGALFFCDQTGYPDGTITTQPIGYNVANGRIENIVADIFSAVYFRSLVGSSVPTSIPNTGLPVTVLYDALTTNANNISYDPSTGVFTVTPPGTYLVCVDYAFDAQTTSNNTYISLYYGSANLIPPFIPPIVFVNEYYRSGQNIQTGSFSAPFSSTTTFNQFIIAVTNNDAAPINLLFGGGGFGIRNAVRVMRIQ